MGNEQQGQQKRVELRKSRSFNPYSERKLRSSSVMMSSNVQGSGRQSTISPQFTLNPNQNRQSQYDNLLPSYATFADQTKLVVSQTVTPMNKQLSLSRQNSSSPNNQMKYDKLLGITPRNFQRQNEQKKSILIYNAQNMNQSQQLHSNSQINQSINGGANNLVLNKYYNGQDMKNRSGVILNKYFNGELIDQNVLSNISQNHRNKTQQKIDTSQLNNLTIKDHHNGRYISKVPMSERILIRRNSDNLNATFQQQIEAFTKRSIKARRKQELKYQHQDDFQDALDFIASYSLCSNLFTRQIQTLVQPFLISFNQDIVQPFIIPQTNESQQMQDKMQNEIELQKYLQYLNDIENSTLSRIDFAQIAKEKREDEELNFIFKQKEQAKIEQQKNKNAMNNLQKQMQQKNQSSSQHQNFQNDQKISKKEYPNKEFTNMIEMQTSKNTIKLNLQKQNSNNFSVQNSQRQKNLRFIDNLQDNEDIEEKKMQKSTTPYEKQKNKAEFDIKEEQRKLFSKQPINQNGNEFKANNKLKQMEQSQISQNNDQNLIQDFVKQATITEEEWNSLGNPMLDNSRDYLAKNTNIIDHSNEQSKEYQNQNEIDNNKDDSRYGKAKMHHLNESKILNNKSNSFAKNVVQNKNSFSNMSSIVLNNSEQEMNQYQYDEDKNQKIINQKSNPSPILQNTQRLKQQNLFQNSIIVPQKVQQQPKNEINQIRHEIPPKHDRDNNRIMNESYQSKLSDEDQNNYFQNQQNQNRNQGNQQQNQQQKQRQTAHFFPIYEQSQRTTNKNLNLTKDSNQINQNSIQQNLGIQNVSDKKYNQQQSNMKYNQEISNQKSNKIEKYNLKLSPQKQNGNQTNESFYVDVHKIEDEENMKRQAYKRAEEEYDEGVRKKELEDMILEKQIIQTKDSIYQAFLYRQKRIKELSSKYYMELKNQKTIKERSNQYQNSYQQRYEIEESFENDSMAFQNNRLHQTNTSYGQNNTNHFNSGQIYSPNPKQQLYFQNNSNDKYKNTNIHINLSNSKRRDSNLEKNQLEQNQNQNSQEKNSESIYNSNFYKDNEQTIVNAIMTNNAFRREDQDDRQKNYKEQQQLSLDLEQQKQKERENNLLKQQQIQREQEELQLKLQQEEENQKKQQKCEDGIFDLDAFEEIDEEEHHIKSDDDNDQNSSEDENKNQESIEDSFDEQNSEKDQKIKNKNLGRNQLSIITDVTFKSDSQSPSKHDQTIPPIQTDIQDSEISENKEKQNNPKKEESSMSSKENSDKSNSESDEQFIKDLAEQVERLKSKIEKDKQNLDQGNNEIQSKLASKMQINLSNSNLPHSDDLSNNSHIFPNQSNKMLTNIFSSKYVPAKSENNIQIQSELNLSNSQSQQNNSPHQSQKGQQNQQKDQKKQDQQQSPQIKQDPQAQILQTLAPQDQKQKVSNQPFQILINPKKVSPAPSTGKSQSVNYFNNLNMEDSKLSQKSAISSQSNKKQQKQKVPFNQASKIISDYTQNNEITVLSSPGQKVNLQPPFEFHQAVSEYGFDTNSQQTSFPLNIEEKTHLPQIAKLQQQDSQNHAPSPSDTKIGYDALKAKRQGRLNTIKSQVEPSEDSSHQTHTMSRFGTEQQLSERKLSMNSQISKKSNQTNSSKNQEEKNHKSNSHISHHSSAYNSKMSKQQNAKSRFSHSQNQIQPESSSQSLKNQNDSEASSVHQSKIQEQSNNSLNKLFKDNKNQDSYYSNHQDQFSQFSLPFIDENNQRRPSQNKSTSSKNLSRLSSQNNNDNNEFQFGTPKNEYNKEKHKNKEIYGKNINYTQQLKHKKSDESSIYEQNNSKINSIQNQNQWNFQSGNSSHRSSNIEDHREYQNTHPQIEEDFFKSNYSNHSNSKKEINQNQQDIQSSHSSKQGYDMFDFGDIQDKSQSRNKNQSSSQYLDESEYNNNKQNKNDHKSHNQSHVDDPNNILDSNNAQEGVFDLDAFGFSNED